MKGIVFTEFLEMVEGKFGYEMVDYLLENTELASGGVYTSIGTYSHQEMVGMVVNLSKKTEIPLPGLLKAFGSYLFQTFTKAYSHFLEATDNAFDFLESIENYIHVEVRKLYPDAELPSFETEKSGQKLEMIYTSERKMSDLAEGLIESALEYYGEEATVTKENLDPEGTKVKFTIERA